MRRIHTSRGVPIETFFLLTAPKEAKTDAGQTLDTVGSLALVPFLGASLERSRDSWPVLGTASCFEESEGPSSAAAAEGANSTPKTIPSN